MHVFYIIISFIKDTTVSEMEEESTDDSLVKESYLTKIDPRICQMWTNMVYNLI